MNPRWLLLALLVACGRYVSVGREDQAIPLNDAGAAGAEPAGGEAGEVSSAGFAGSAGEAGAVGGPADGGAAGQAGAPSAVVSWSATHDEGNLDEWLGDDAGYQYIEGNAELGLTTEHAHSGTHAIVATIDAQNGALTQAVLVRELELEEGRYGAWYFLPELPSVDYWVIMKLSHGAADRFDIDVSSMSDGEPRLRLFEHGVGYISEPSSVALPVGKWFHVEALYRSTSSADGRLMVLQDGVTVLDTGPRATADSAQVTWICGSSARYMSPTPYRLFIDDAHVDSGFGL